MKLFITAKPKAKTARIEKIAEDRFRIWVREAADGGKANEAVLEALADYFGEPRSRFKLLAGHQSRQKVVGYSPAE